MRYGWVCGLSKGWHAVKVNGLPPAELGEKVVEDYRNLGLSLKAHPLDLLAKPLSLAGWQL